MSADLGRLQKSSLEFYRSQILHGTAMSDCLHFTADGVVRARGVRLWGRTDWQCQTGRVWGPINSFTLILRYTAFHPSHHLRQGGPAPVSGVPRLSVSACVLRPQVSENPRRHRKRTRPW